MGKVASNGFDMIELRLSLLGEGSGNADYDYIRVPGTFLQTRGGFDPAGLYEPGQKQLAVLVLDVADPRVDLANLLLVNVNTNNCETCLR